jgi:HK97 family phage major capsid protein
MKQKLSDLYAQRKSKADELEGIINGGHDKNAEERLNNGLAELEGLDWEIRKTGVRDRIDAGGIVPQGVMGTATIDMRTEVRDFFAGGYKTGGKLELRATGTSSVGGTTTVADPTFIQRMDRDSVLFRLATVTSVTSGAPVRFYRQDSYMSLETSVTAQAGAYASKDIAGEAVDFTPSKLGIVTTVSNEALRDMPFDVASETIRQHAELHGNQWENNFFLGTNNQSLTTNFNTYSSFGSQSVWDWGGSTSTTAGNNLTSNLTGTATSIVISDAVAAVYGAGLRPQYLANSCWLLNPTIWANTVAQSGTVVYPMGNGYSQSLGRDGIGQPEVPGNRAGVNFMGYPVYFASAMPLGSTATNHPQGVFGNIERGYRIVRLDSVPMIADPYTAAANGQVRFLSETRCIGKILDKNAMVTLLV